MFHPFVILIQRVKKQAFFKRFCFVTSKRQALVENVITILRSFMMKLYLWCFWKMLKWHSWKRFILCLWNTIRDKKMNKRTDNADSIGKLVTVKKKSRKVASWRTPNPCKIFTVDNSSAHLRLFYTRIFCMKFYVSGLCIFGSMFNLEQNGFKIL